MYFTVDDARHAGLSTIEEVQVYHNAALGWVSDPLHVYTVHVHHNLAIVGYDEQRENLRDQCEDQDRTACLVGY